MKVLILGVNGFIGNALTHRILTTTDWEVYGLDMACDKLERSLGDPGSIFWRGTSLSTRSGSSTTSRSAT